MGRPKKSASAVMDLWFGLWFPESNTYYGLAASKLPANLRKMAVGETRPMKWDKEMCHACCIYKDNKQNVNKLVDDLVNGEKTFSSLNLPQVDNTQKASSMPKAAKKINKVEKKKEVPKTLVYRSQCNSRRGTKKSSEKVETTTINEKNVSRSRKIEKDDTPLSIAVKNHQDANIRLEKAEKSVREKLKKKEEIEKELIEKQRELMEARAHLESTLRTKDEELKKREIEEKEKEDEEKKKNGEKERVKRRNKEIAKEEEKMEEETKKKEVEKREEHREQRSNSDESGIHIMMPDIDSDMNGEGDDDVQYISTIDLETNTQMKGDEDGPSTSYLPDPSMPSTSNIIFIPLADSDDMETLH